MFIQEVNMIIKLMTEQYLCNIKDFYNLQKINLIII